MLQYGMIPSNLWLEFHSPFGGLPGGGEHFLVGEGDGVEGEGCQCFLDYQPAGQVTEAYGQGGWVQLNFYKSQLGDLKV